MDDTQDVTGLSSVRDLLSQVQAGARVTTAIGEPVQIGERLVIPAAEITYCGGGGGGGGKMIEQAGGEGRGGGGGAGVRIRPLGCWVIGPQGEYWLPALDVNRAVIIAGSILMLFMLTIKMLVRRL